MKKSIFIILIVLVLIGGGLFLFKDKVFNKNNTYDLYIEYLSKYENNEILDREGNKVKVDNIYVRMIEVNGIDKPVMMVDAENESGERILNMYYVDKEGNVRFDAFDNDTYYNAIYNYENKDYKYYLLKRTSDDVDFYDHIISLANYINDDSNKEEHDLIEYDPTYIGFELDEKVLVNGNTKEALKKAIKNMKSLDEFYKQEKEIIDDAHQEYKAMHED